MCRIGSLESVCTKTHRNAPFSELLELSRDFPHGPPQRLGLEFLHIPRSPAHHPAAMVHFGALWCACQNIAQRIPPIIHACGRCCSRNSLKCADVLSASRAPSIRLVDARRRPSVGDDIGSNGGRARPPYLPGHHTDSIGHARPARIPAALEPRPPISLTVNSPAITGVLPKSPVSNLVLLFRWLRAAEAAPPRR
ncbi:MAG: hypothetical protein JWN51_1387 [Phycisphaerales bacterium]|nr:hypothetical protein [Phycisphaerales bacterium]